MVASACQSQDHVSDLLIYRISDISALWLCFLSEVEMELSFAQTQRGADFGGGSRALEWRLCWGEGLGGGGDTLFEK